MKKKFLLVAPQGFNLYRLIVDNLEYLGFEVVHIENFGYSNFKYKSLIERLNNFFRKSFLGDKTFKDTLKMNFVYRKQYELLNSFDSYDYALVLRADFFTIDFIKAVCQKSNLSISFHFDGIDRDRKILDYVSLFDKFYVFDKDDVINYPTQKFIYSSNFYFDYPLPVVSPLIDNTYEVYYVSTFNESRASYLIELHEFLTQLYTRVCFIVVINEGMEEKVPSYIKDNLTVQYDLIPFAEQLKYVSTSELIIDLVLTEHNGFSFRIFEGLKYSKKVITTNKRVVEADFYHPNNYFVLNSNNYSEIKSFLELPYIFIDSLVKEKYSFTNWLEDKLEDQTICDLKNRLIRR